MSRPLKTGTRKAFQNCHGLPLLIASRRTGREKSDFVTRNALAGISIARPEERAAKAPPPAFLFPIPHNVKEPENEGLPSSSRHVEPAFTRAPSGEERAL